MTGTWLLLVLAAQTRAIADNSFLIEEAYNQEPGVVQHISTFLKPSAGDAWLYTFTQEWPLRGQRSQLSFTLPVERLGLGEVALNYRYQLAGADGLLAAAPRLSVLLHGRPGLQINLPASVAVAKRVVTHWNAGVTVTPAATTGYNAGASVIWLVRPAVNLLVELAWTRAETDALVLSPGIRWAHNFAGGLQVVPGIAFPMGIGAAPGEDGVLLYLSLEHPFMVRE